MVDGLAASKCSDTSMFGWLPSFCPVTESDVKPPPPRVRGPSDEQLADQYYAQVDPVSSTMNAHMEFADEPVPMDHPEQQTMDPPDVMTADDHYQCELPMPDMKGRSSIVSVTSGQDETTKNLGCCHCAPKMDEPEMLDRVTWCNYLVCCGCGYTNVPTYFNSSSKCVVCVHRVDNTPWYNINGCCNIVHSCCCCTALCQLPPRGQSSQCVCCNAHSRGTFATKPWEEIGRSAGCGVELATQVYDFVLFEKFVPCYFWCCGLGVTPFMEFCNAFTKCGGLQWKFTCASPGGEEGCCKIQHSCWSCHMHAKIPPKHIGNPIVGCCGWRLRKVGHHSTKTLQKQHAGHRASQSGQV